VSASALAATGLSPQPLADEGAGRFGPSALPAGDAAGKALGSLMETALLIGFGRPLLTFPAEVIDDDRFEEAGH